MTFFPREHGATAMLLIPFASAAVLVGVWHPAEAAVLAAAICAYRIKEPLLVLARRRPEGKREARAWVAVLGLVAVAAGGYLAWRGPWRAWAVLSLGAAAFSLLAIVVNVRNRQRAAWFQVASAAALTSTCIGLPLAALGDIPGWAWQLWILFTLQAAAGILAVHARLDARIALRHSQRPPEAPRRKAFFAAGVLGASMFAFDSRWIDLAVGGAAVCYFLELLRQRSTRSLETKLTRIGVESLLVSLAFAATITVGLLARN